jgi:hypothetical protein
MFELLCGGQNALLPTGSPSLTPERVLAHELEKLLTRDKSWTNVFNIDL